MRNEKIITSNKAVKEENDHHVDIRPDENALEGCPGWAHSLYYRHKERNRDDQSMCDESLHNTVMRNVV